MYSYNEALEYILRLVPEGRKELVTPLMAHSRILCEDIYSDRDYPPYDRVAMDGIAISFQAIINGVKEFKNENLALPGMPQKKLQNLDCCIEIATGSVLPKNTDTVIRYEDLIENDGIFKIINNVKQFQNIHYKGSDSLKNTRIIEAGTSINSTHIHSIASVGKTEILVKAWPRVAVLSTGNELVPLGENIESYQIRSSNKEMISSILSSRNVSYFNLQLSDDFKEIEEAFQYILATADIIFCTGGISKGKSDLIPKALHGLGVKLHFNEVKQRPGKPFYFGTKDQVFIFGFPGNPVSAHCCFMAYGWPVYQKLAGKKLPRYKKIQLESSFNFNPKLTLFAPFQIVKSADGKDKAKIMKGNGSGDMFSVHDMDGYLILPEEISEFATGDAFKYIPVL